MRFFHMGKGATRKKEKRKRKKEEDVVTFSYETSTIGLAQESKDVICARECEPVG